jgi:sterol desaturase/sphingolipid hydroxylase (fatty acid hydroxylase superfamily)
MVEEVEMANIKVNTSEEPIRLFKSDFLEFFTHISPLAVLAIWLPVIGYFLCRAFLQNAQALWTVFAAILAGLFIWTLAEYVLHRFLFHFPAKTAWQKRLSFLFHGIHHEQPRVKTRLVMPPAVSIPLAAIFFGLFYLLIGLALGGTQWVAPVFAGFLMGYVIYDMTHYSTHHIPMKKGYLRLIRQQHMHHHFQTPDKRFGVTSPIWDYVFGTMPSGKK